MSKRNRVGLTPCRPTLEQRKAWEYAEKLYSYGENMEDDYERGEVVAEFGFHT